LEKIGQFENYWFLLSTLRVNSFWSISVAPMFGICKFYLRASVGTVVKISQFLGNH